MRILHICIGNPYTETLYYKENYLIEANLLDGNEVVVLADTSTWDKNKIICVDPCDKRMPEGYRLIRIETRNVLGKYLGGKLRIIKGFTEKILSIKPDVILFHNLYQEGICHLKEIVNGIPFCKIYGDSSATYENSATNNISKIFQHKLLYKTWIWSGLPYIEKIFYVNESAKSFLQEMYKIPEKKLELNSLPAKIVTEEDAYNMRCAFRQKHNLAPNTFVVFHSGKMDKNKKTLELMKEILPFLKKNNSYLFIAGSFYEDIREEAINIIEKNTQIVYLGFLDIEEMREAMCASDVYLQPGSASQSAQTAIACGTPIILSGRNDYQLFIDGNGYIIDDISEVPSCLTKMDRDREGLAEMSKKSREIACEYFDYRKLARRFYI